MPRLLPALLLLAACSDYGLNKADDNPETGEPALVAPEAVSAVVCEQAEVPVTLSNEGDRALEVESLAVRGEGWSLEETGPLTIEPGESHTLSLLAGVGEATLTVISDDPDTPERDIALSATADQPPEVSITTPADGRVVDIGAVERFEGLVLDDVDEPDLLSVTWTSDLEGELASVTPDGSGLVSLSWEAGARSSGEQQLVLSATDSCGNLSVDHVGLCQQAGYVADELDISTWNFEGSAYWDSASRQVVLTDADVNVVGTAFQTGQTAPGDSLSIRFSFYIGDGSGADGLSLTALDTTRMTGFLGGTGCGMGYGGDADCTAGPALPGWSIEIDTHYNEGQDPTAADHLMFTFDGDVDDPAYWVELDEMEDTGWHTLEVSVEAPQVTVTLDGAVVMDEALSGNFVFPAYVGFTAGTGSLTNRHLIRALEVTEYVCGE
ncbi:MAG: hypothetical protein H6741_25110 [Alphaproteobacteria bacterium]|nr:hypothetical protein [Alphaproteobacteria bacterium]MCB9795989.1 hypothetical protein [Alphaproteobacteria bacterium]